MADRRRQIELLLATRFDYSFEPETFTGKVVRRGATAGKGSPSHWQPCPSCDGGSRRDRFGKLIPCDVCNATGRLRVDDYTGDVVVTDEDKPIALGDLIRRDTKTVRCPDCQDLAGNATGVIRGEPCRRCSGTGSAPIPGSWLSEPADPDRQPGDPLDAMLNQIQRRNTIGSYRDLDQALAGIAHHANKPLRFIALTANHVQTLRLLDDVYLTSTREVHELSLFEAALVELALAYIDERMPDPIIVPADVVANVKITAGRARWPKGQALTSLERERRDKQIRQWERQGKPRQWIGEQTGLSDRQLREIINGARSAA